MNSARRRWPLTALCVLVLAGACATEQPASRIAGDLPCTIESAEPAERLVLVSEAQAARAAGRKHAADFVLSTRATSALRLQLKAVGCSCYQVLHNGRSLRVGDELVIAANATARVRIAADPATEPGVRDYRAELVGHRLEGTAFTVSLSHSIRTLPDVVVRPDVVQVDLDAASSSLTDGVPVHIEQIVRVRDPDEVSAAWDAMPHGITATSPALSKPAAPFGDGLWSVHRRTTIGVRSGGEADLDSDRPVPLSLVSRRSGIEIARTACVLIPRRRSGIIAPPLVHLGRLSPGTTVSRRIQLRAADSQPFVVQSATSRDGTLEVVIVNVASATEHWIEIRASGSSVGIRDELAIVTDHPVTPELRFPVRSSLESTRTSSARVP